MANLRAGAHRVGVVGRAHEDPAHDLLVGPVGVHDRRHLGHVVGRQPVDDRAVALAAGQAQHARAQRGDQDRRHDLGPHAEPEALHRERVVGLARPSRRLSASRRKRTMSRTCLYGSTNGMPFQRSTITFDDVPMPNAKRPGRGVGQRGHATAPCTPARG